MGAAVALMYWLKRAIWALTRFGCCGCVCFLLLSACWSLWVVAGSSILVLVAAASSFTESVAVLSSASNAEVSPVDVLNW